jgi:hypothetical protein
VVRVDGLTLLVEPLEAPERTRGVVEEGRQA